MPLCALFSSNVKLCHWTVANGTGLLPALSSLRNAARNSEYAQPRSSSSGRQTSVATSHPQIVRPLRVVSIYPPSDSQVGTSEELEPFEELTEDDSSDAGAFVDELDVTQDESSDMATAAFDTTVVASNTRENRDGTAATSDTEFEFTTSAYEDSETSSNVEDHDMSESSSRIEEKAMPFDRNLSKRDVWRALKSSLTSEEYETFKNVLQREPSRDLDENEDGEAVGMTGRERERVKTDDSHESQSWLSLIYDVPPLSTFSMGGYWNDKRFLRTRKMSREMSLISGTESLLDKANIVLAMIRDVGAVKPKGREYSSHGSLICHVHNVILPCIFHIQDALLVASQRLQSESDIVTATSDLLVNSNIMQDSATALPPASSSHVSDVESSEDDDVSEQSVRPDEVEFLPNDAEPRA
ncbi:hypothetical protein DICVIV_07659 [Dictyocaulus viviparus]|uniref:Uncharacterized protein n=1 Tax=Dictyocaulus viviparus TaxID=29172 RepID=A0A0D8XR87_DICVI|nr:hypothetical protein DICVIV_07659 [Dictyocaulus viviparus]